MQPINSSEIIFDYIQELQGSLAGKFKINSSIKKSRSIDFLNDLYSYPPKFRIKWQAIDELNNDSFVYSKKNRNNDTSFSSKSSKVDFLSTSDNDFITKQRYSLGSYISSYTNNISSTKIYNNKNLQKLQNSLKDVPVYVILNEIGEIVLANSTNFKNSNSLKPDSILHNISSNFDPLADNTKKLGLFFMSRKDAEIFLDEIAMHDPQGTKIFGLSVHCVGLDFAYRTFREYNSEIDFRFVPDLKEVKKLLTVTNFENFHFIFDNEQQQLRLRYRSVNPIPLFNSVIHWGGPISSFLEKGDYFKGVPIYIVKVSETPTNFLLHSYYTGINMIDTISGAVCRSLFMALGFGNSWILQGSFSPSFSTEKTKICVFFEKKEALKFCQQNGRKISRYPGTYINILNPITKKPKIYVYNLEDFLELCEENLTETLLVRDSKSIEKIDPNALQFIPTNSALSDIQNYSEANKKPLLPKVVNFFSFKYRRLNSFIQLILNSN